MPIRVQSPLYPPKQQSVLDAILRNFRCAGKWLHTLTCEGCYHAISYPRRDPGNRSAMGPIEG